jgi:hypothetical protein
MRRQGIQGEYTRGWNRRDDLRKLQLVKDSSLSGIMEPDNYDIDCLLPP